MQTLTRAQLALLAALTLTWGLNWPVMKLGVTGYPPLAFRSLSLWLGLPVLALAMVAMKLPFRISRRHWPELLGLSATNMFVWQGCMILALVQLSSGRAAILGYTMPIFSAVIGALLFATGLGRRGWLGVGAAATGVVLLLWHELTALAGRPAGVGLALFAAATWALGTQMLRRSRIEVPILTLSFWMTALTAALLTALSAWLEGNHWRAPTPVVSAAVAYNAVIIFGFAQVIWLSLARNLPPLASSLSVMLIPVLGLFSGALWLGEVLHWQDWAAVALMVVALASVLWPAPRVAAA